jgi:hypothetical protein
MGPPTEEAMLAGSSVVARVVAGTGDLLYELPVAIGWRSTFVPARVRRPWLLRHPVSPAATLHPNRRAAESNGPYGRAYNSH